MPMAGTPLVPKRGNTAGMPVTYPDAASPRGAEVVGCAGLTWHAGRSSHGAGTECDGLCAVRGVPVKIRPHSGGGEGALGGLAGAEEATAAVDRPIGFFGSWRDDSSLQGAELGGNVEGWAGVADERAAAEVACLQGVMGAAARHRGLPHAVGVEVEGVDV